MCDFESINDTGIKDLLVAVSRNDENLDASTHVNKICERLKMLYPTAPNPEDTFRVGPEWKNLREFAERNGVLHFHTLKRSFSPQLYIAVMTHNHKARSQTCRSDTHENLSRIQWLVVIEKQGIQ